MTASGVPALILGNSVVTRCAVEEWITIFQMRSPTHDQPARCLTNHAVAKIFGDLDGLWRPGIPGRIRLVRSDSDPEILIDGDFFFFRP